MLPVKKKRCCVAFRGKLQQTNCCFLSLVEGLWKRKALLQYVMFDPRAYIDLILQLVKLKLVLSTP